MPSRRLHRAAGLAALCAVLAVPASRAFGRAAEVLPADRGASGTWQKLLKLRTTASAMHTTAHPDDEHGGVLAWISRGQGARLSLLTLNRGESGDNAIGAELFDGLGLIRTEELLLADRYYGVDDQYFTPVVDYGYSKRLDEALEKWGKEDLLREVVRVVRMDRPLVLIARFQGSSRDGHGNHMAAGLVTREAFRAAGDPAMFPEHAAEGLRPWRPLKLYTGGARENEDWTIRTDADEYSPGWATRTATSPASASAFSARRTAASSMLTPGSAYGYYRRLASTVAAPDKETSFFDGIDTRLSGLFATLDRSSPAGAAEALRAIEREVGDAVARFTMTDPSAVVPALARGLQATRAALGLVASDPDATFLLRIKERQFMAAINAALGVELTAVAQPSNTPEPTGPGWTVAPAGGALPAVLGRNGVATRRFDVTLADDAPLSSRPHYSRPSITVNRYELANAAERNRPVSAPDAVAVARYSVAGVAVEAREALRRREPQLPYGHALREVRVVPALAVNLSPPTAVIPARGARRSITLQVELIGNVDGALDGTLALELPSGWTARPPAHAFRFSAPASGACSPSTWRSRRSPAACTTRVRWRPRPASSTARAISSCIIATSRRAISTGRRAARCAGSTRRSRPASPSATSWAPATRCRPASPSSARRSSSSGPRTSPRATSAASTRS